MAGAAEAEEETVFPRAGWLEDSPVFYLSDFTNAGERINEGVFFAKCEEGEVGTGVAEAGDARGDVELSEAADFFFPFMVLADHLGEEGNGAIPLKAGA